MKIYSFTMWIKTSEDEGTIADCLYESGCDDCLCGVFKGSNYIEFDRRASSLKEAIKIAEKDIQALNLDIKIVKVEIDL